VAALWTVTAKLDENDETWQQFQQLPHQTKGNNNNHR